MKKPVKIVATIGPATHSKEMIENLAKAGVDIFRINLSHAYPEEVADRCRWIRAAEKVLDRPLTIMGDLSGPKIRITEMKPDTMLVKGQTFLIDKNITLGDENGCGLNHPSIIDNLEVGAEVFIDDGAIELIVEKKQRVLVTTLTKRMAEELSGYLDERAIKVTYLHSDIETLERQDVLDSLRRGDFDVLVGINLLREGLDLPEVSLVAILDADKEGFLRSRTSLIQTMGRAARNVDAEVIMYADNETKSMKAAIDEVNRRRAIQIAYNEKHGITPMSIQKAIRARLVEEQKEEEKTRTVNELIKFNAKDVLLPDEREKLLKLLRKEMKEAAERLDFETAIHLRDKVKEIQKRD